MIAGRLRHLVDFQAPIRTRGTAGSAKVGWPVNGHKAWASIEPLRGSESLVAKQVSETLSHRIRTRYSSELSAMNATWRAVFGTRTFEIVSVINRHEQNLELEIMCAETR